MNKVIRWGPTFAAIILTYQKDGTESASIIRRTKSGINKLDYYFRSNYNIGISKPTGISNNNCTSRNTFRIRNHQQEIRKTMTERTIVINIDSEIGNRLYRLIQVLTITFPSIIKEKIKL